MENKKEQKKEDEFKENEQEYESWLIKQFTNFENGIINLMNERQIYNNEITKIKEEADKELERLNKDNYAKKYNNNKNINLDTNGEISTNLKTNLNTNVKNGKKTKKIFKSFSNRLIYENQKKEPKYKKIDLLTAQSNKILEKDKYKKIKLTTQVKLNTKSTFSLLKEQNTASSFNN